MSHIFISYSRHDIDLAGKIVQALADNELDTWADWKSIPKGEDWEQEIYRGIEEADAFLFLISPDSVRSEMCNKEIAHAVKNGKRILPIVIRDTDIKNIHPEISKRNWIFCREGKDKYTKAIEEIRTTIHTDYEWLEFHTDLQIKALKWEQKKDASRLLRGKELQEAEEQLTESNNQEDPKPTKLQREYVLASRRSEERLRARITVGLGIGLLVVLALSILFWIQRNVAISQRAIAVSRALAINANDALGTDDGSLSLLLALESVSPTYSLDGSVTPEAESILRRAIAASPWRETIVGRLGAIISMVEHNGLVAVTDDDTTVRLWNVNSGEYVTILNHHLESADAIAFSPSGEFLAVAGGDGTVAVWNVDTLREAAVFRGHTKIVNALAFSPNGNSLATASSDTTVRLWNVETAGQEAIFKGHTDSVNGLAFNPDGELLATASDDQTVRLWDIVTGQEVIILQN